MTTERHKPRAKKAQPYTIEARSLCNGNGHFMIEQAIRISIAFRDREPKVHELRERFGMSRATAYRWRRAWRLAHGLDGVPA